MTLVLFFLGGGGVLKESGDKILENSGLSGLKSHRGRAKVDSVWP